MAKYVCNVCGYVYDEEAGDAEYNIAAGTKFDELPPGWLCPLCAMGKEHFEEA